MSENMLFCTGSGKWDSEGEGYQKNNRIFNADVTKEQFEKAIGSQPSFELPVAKWVNKEDMTKDEKKLQSYWETTGGYLKTLNYQDAWKEGWKTASPEFKKWVQSLPNFSPSIFKEITGIDFSNTSLVGQSVEVKVGGVTYKAVITE